MSTEMKKNDEAVGATTEEEEPEQPGCGILGRNQVLSVILFALVGIGCGIGLSYWDPPDPDTKKTTMKWIGLLGDLFIRALKAVVLPLVFINVTLSVVEMISLGKTSSIAGFTIGMYLLTTVIASILGLVSILCFQGLFDSGNFDPPDPAYVSLGCQTDGYLMTENVDGSITCAASLSDTDSIDDSQKFIIEDLSKTFATSGGSGPANDISLSDTFYDGVFMKLVTSNIFKSFVDGNFAAVVFFAIMFGLALGRAIIKKKIKKPLDLSNIVVLFREIDTVLITLIHWIILVTPFAVLSLITSAIGKQTNLGDAFANVGFLMLATIIAMIVHFFIVDVGLLWFFTKSNPFRYLKHLIPAQTTAFACASSAATIPVTLESVGNTGKVPPTIANFVVPLGATINMDGGAIYFPCACVWLAFLNDESINFGSYLLLIILATVGSAGTAPVPSASLVLIITAYNTVFGTTGTPEGFDFILAIDWFMDRLRTTLNVTGDACVSGMVAAKCGVVNDTNNNNKTIADGADDETGKNGDNNDLIVVKDVEAEVGGGGVETTM